MFQMTAEASASGQLSLSPHSSGELSVDHISPRPRLKVKVKPVLCPPGAVGEPGRKACGGHGTESLV